MEMGASLCHTVDMSSVLHDRAIGSNFRQVRPLPKLMFVREVQEDFLHLHFSVVWIGSHSTFVLFTALLTAEYAEGDTAQLEDQQCPQAL